GFELRRPSSKLFTPMKAGKTPRGPPPVPPPPTRRHHHSRSRSVMNDPAGRQGVQRQIRAFLQAIATGRGKPIEQMSPREARAVLEGLQSSVKVDLPQADIAERTISSERQTVKVGGVRPASVTGRLPVFMFFHGGGWVLGDFPTHQRLVRDLVAGSGATAVFVEYDRSPQGPD